MRPMFGKVAALLVGWVAVTLTMTAVLLEPVSEKGEVAGALSSALLWAGLAGVVLALVVAFGVMRILGGTLDELRDALHRLAEGTLRQRLPWHGRDSLGEIARSVQRIAEQNRGAVVEVTSEKERLQAMLQGMVEGVLVLDPEGRVVLANPRLREFFDVWGEVEGRSLLELIRRDDLVTALDAASASSSPVTRDFTVDGADERLLQMHAVRFPSEGAMLGTVAVFHDLSEVRRLERVRQEFVANVSHELKTPLTAIQGFAETLQHEGLDAAQRTQYTEVILRHSNRLSALIEDLLELSRIEGGRQLSERSEVPVAEVARALLQDLKPRFDANDLHARIEAETEPIALADRRAVEQILLNLLDNAIKYSEPGGTVVVEVGESQGRVQLAVRDSGMGIPAEDLGRIFERFYRVDKARSRDLGGTGLGLSIVKHLAQAMDGDVDVEAEEGVGSTFRVSLALLDAPLDNVTPS
ncbi:MAG: PAS domain-containing protein [bacterium]|nr:PAS domain-containing protein [bacterium]